ncbi:Putative beta-lactamase [Erythrobacter sp. NAP1]|uniref:class A beta-lactamase n=1 Tax=Erythrobacter sp. NAP1 TaxID=237727 RepID=UPI0000686E0F|nr:class A beta-lactamase [Erythrobacter sp. NAP1]EAQ30395.1 Putative beta-lactamase [Erythrobacter sp. NAP1]
MSKMTGFRFLALFLPILALVVWIAASAEGEGQPSTIVALDAPSIAIAIATPEERAFEQRLEEIGASLTGTVGIAVQDVETGELYEFNGDELLPQQSVTKLWVAMAALSQVDQGDLNLTERVRIGRDDLTLFHQPVREIVKARGSYDTNYRDLFERSITRSDNTANDRLLRRIGGPDAVQQWLDDKGLTGIRFGTDERSKQSAIAGLDWSPFYSIGRQFYEARDRVPDAMRRAAFEGYLADPIDGASANAIASALTKLARGDLLDTDTTRLLRDTLEQTRSGPRRLKGGAPEGWRVEHKTGTGQVYGNEQSGYNDVGILTSPDGREYAIAVLIGRTSEPTPARMEMMQQVTSATAQFHEDRKDAAGEPMLAGADS